MPIFFLLHYLTVVIVNFDQSTYTIDEDDGPLQPVLILSNPSTHLINVQVNSTDGSAVGEFTLI